MEGAGDSNMEVKIEIQSELMSINTVVTKIKQELHDINDIVQNNGTLDNALKNAIDSLVLIAEEGGITVANPALGTGQENPMANALSRITTGYITEKLKALSHQSNDSLT